MKASDLAAAPRQRGRKGGRGGGTDFLAAPELLGRWAEGQVFGPHLLPDSVQASMGLLCLIPRLQLSFSPKSWEPSLSAPLLPPSPPPTSTPCPSVSPTSSPWLPFSPPLSFYCSALHSLSLFLPTLSPLFSLCLPPPICLSPSPQHWSCFLGLSGRLRSQVGRRRVEGSCSH